MLDILAGALCFLAIISRCCPESRLGAWVNKVLLATLARKLIDIRRVHLFIVIASICILPIAGNLIMMAGSLELIIMYVTHTAIYADVLLAGITVASLMRFKAIGLAAKSFIKRSSFF